ncbi:LEAF RUST 10 DISEASE-RESISTANCE LOCUS RECEPTOR-LIKE PROTEIN KINASE-like 2.4 isoform X1 [Sorghum bicolor]|uniref:LEAF RUST 10 DISEASE-RESISTANCE LOCUS RECEPTOR-LIKE PROTEIN KINASE-like 2.4 isoform X1 n=1 Tax=Sorghum bicolor TaxID=4558 RepID=UPI000B425671|nr:LEAF RUST 10 DISEASE-RESISTANCE LOCUS RECEPTOR-LIKE PROTEIN KINASE-like 2.4 isoform X1 [Sorghum bicolor]XP_021313712.1 LEAF RUST 10 DISEASE-RESISTANCE LOCUS RECEPTOR-LIKE PROTEIN KINASE-like 2.4 isoform X1 [Sorghum bicolor]XP_021313713.1 LEAF RUST 10 DISEASE-RESISTANCE LOCUS RECEPTOR-LIKE PROTEIN KINASE-like 2.4 isoform X1 [Sorghum bicolor]|eukprot:XP_021313711.1 LEAF RUST 10 DISEASE-RESISTANCE LOCUS RECEPTOR-LIKE PROTEIN KINASE-like 2.4 isoform X1 [Sorghum bicolor]
MLLPWRWPRPCRGLSLVSSLWTAWVMLAAAAADRQGGELCSPVVCGGVNISFPFGNIADHATEANCGVLGFQVRCTNNTPYLGSYKGDYRFKILDIFYGDTSLLIADVHKLEDFNASASSSFKQPCYSPKNNCSAKLGYPFSISPANQNIIFYNCEETPTQAVRQSRGLVDTACGNKTLVGVAKRPDVPGSYFMEGCNATVVPMLVRSGEANPANYKELISDGFLLTWQEQPLPPPSPPSAAGVNGNGRKIALIVSISVAASLLLPCIYVLIWYTQKLRFFLCKKTSSTIEENIEALLLAHGSLAPKRYKYSELTKITSSLNNKLGEGGYGMVFRGRLDDGRLVAVKFLHDSKGDGEEFVNEVMSIGRTSHINIVSLFGFCLEGSKRALIYEYMPNGSLDKYIYSENPKAVLGWDKLYTIAIGIARGLEYLHHSCNTRIVHFDIKPQNILLDQNFHPKIADFGLAKLCRTKESKLSMTGARGTPGFIAPEVHSRTFGVVSTKSDVYSYGMMLLEMVGGRKNVKSVAQESSEKYFPHWIYDHFGQDDGLPACEVTSENEGIAKKMSVIGLWCIQILPMHRPTIGKVLEMFDRGLDELDMPPRQNFSEIFLDPAYSLNAESTSMISGTKTKASSEVLKMKEISIVNSKILQRLPTL